MTKITVDALVELIEMMIECGEVTMRYAHDGGNHYDLMSATVTKEGKKRIQGWLDVRKIDAILEKEGFDPEGFMSEEVKAANERLRRQHDAMHEVAKAMTAKVVVSDERVQELIAGTGPQITEAEYKSISHEDFVAISRAFYARKYGRQ